MNENKHARMYFFFFCINEITMKRDEKGVSSQQVSRNKKKNNLNTRERKLRAIAWFLTNLHSRLFFCYRLLPVLWYSNRILSKRI